MKSWESKVRGLMRGEGVEKGEETMEEWVWLEYII